MILILIGCPGAGKGTQSAQIGSHYSIPHLSTGEILRAAKASGNALGERVAPILDSGELVGDELMVQVIAERLGRTDCQGGFLLDGFPRTVPQAQSLELLLQSRQQPLTAAIELQVPVAELRGRLLNRAKEAAHPRPEDQPDEIDKRLDLYASKTAPLLDFYRNQDRLISVNGRGDPVEIFQAVREQLALRIKSSND